MGDRIHSQRPHQGRWCYGKTPMQTLIATLPLAKEKLMVSIITHNNYHGSHSQH
jgi:hypothetical protein